MNSFSNNYYNIFTDSGTDQGNQSRLETAPTTNQALNSNFDLSGMDAQQALKSQQIIQSLALDK